MKRLFAALVACIFVVTSLSLVSISPASASTVVKQRLRYAIKHLPGAAETPGGYDRDKFTLWIDANHDCQDTRAEVLISESKRATTGACTVRTGKWLSYYDRTTFTQASGLDIDHLVPLAEAWRSGAKRWNAATRKAYANDLGDSRTLVAVSAHANRSKGDRDPAQWMPQYGKCTYVRQWVAVKIRWRLKVNPAERRALTRTAARCANTLITVRRATVVAGTGGGTGGGTTTGGGGGAGLDPRFSTCAEAKSHGYGPYYQGKDPEYAWYEDRDHDGIVCE